MHIGRPGISAIRAVPSTAHGMLKFPVDGGIVTIYNTAAPPKDEHKSLVEVNADSEQNATKVTNLKVAIHPDYPEQEVSIGGSLSDTGRAAVCALLQRNLDIFAWEPKHMTGVPRSITEHKLKIRQDTPLALVAGDVVDFMTLTKHVTRSSPLPEIDWKWCPYVDTPSSASWTLQGVSPIQKSKDGREKDSLSPSQAASCRKRQWCHPNFLREQRKEVQSLNGKLAGLNRFLSKSADKSLPLFKTLKKCTKKGDFRWTTEAEEAFTQLKQHIAALPTN
ncbi:hypothetical protein Tco_0718435 [Tanacetum coccineum]